MAPLPTQSTRQDLPDPVSLGEAATYFESYLAFQRRSNRLPGLQAAIFANGSVTMSTACGHADVECNIALTVDHLFRVASHSKTFTATAVMQLVETGVLRLDDEAVRWAGFLAGTPLAQTTIRELLSHSAGAVRDGHDGDFWQLFRKFPDRGELQSVLREPGAAVLARNDRFKYSNMSYSLLGLIIEAASGVPYAELVRTNIVDRLGLRNVGPELEDRRLGEYAIGYSSLAYADARSAIDPVDTHAMAAATGFYANAQDLVTYFSAHFLGDERLLSDVSKRQMQHPLWDAHRGGERYGLGLSVVKVGDRELVGHGGGFPGFITHSLADTTAGLAISVLTNAIDGPAQLLAKAGLRLIDLAGAEPRPPEEPISLSRFTGRFASLWGVTDVALLGGRLFGLSPTATDPVEDAVPLHPVDERTLRIAGGSGYGAYGEPMTFAFSEDGRVEKIRGESGLTLVPLDRFALPRQVGAVSSDIVR